MPGIARGPPRRGIPKATQPQLSAWAIALPCAYPVGNLSESLPPLLAATVAFAIGTSVVLRDRKRDDFVLFAVFCFNLGLFHLAWFFDHFSGITLFGWSGQTISLVLPWTADRLFASLVPNISPRPKSRLQTLMLVSLLAAQAVAFFVLIGHGPDYIDPSMSGPWRLVSGGLDFYVIAALGLAARRIWLAAKAAEGTATAARMRYLFYASILALVFGSPLIPAIGPIVTAVYLYFVAQALLRERLPDLPELLLRIAVLTALVLSLTALYALLLVWIPADAEGRISLTLFNIAVASFSVIVLIDPIRNELESRIEHLVFRDRSALRSMVVGLRQRLLEVIDAEDMVREVIGTLERTNRVTRASVYLLDSEGQRLVLRGEIGSSSPPRRLDVSARRPFVERMLAHGALLRDVLQREHERSEREARAEVGEILDTLRELGASLAVPIISRPQANEEGTHTAEVMGAVFLDDERLLEPFAREEVELFESLAAQAAITLQNSAAYEQRKERERLAELGEMSAGLAHEIRNPLGAIKGAVQVIQPSMATDAASHEFLDVIVEEVERLNHVVTQFLSYSRRHKEQFDTLDVSRVAEATLRLVTKEYRGSIRLDAQAQLPEVMGDAEAIKQVLHNLLLNAIDATREMAESAEIVIEIRVRTRGLASGDAIALRVRDNGPGIPPHAMTHLFVPFHTTKSTGTGLGLPICQRIVENHHGVIEAGNTSDGGACFTVLLPVATEAKAEASA